MSINNNSIPWDSIPTLFPKAFPGSQQVPAALPQPLEAQSETEQGTSVTLAYAKSNNEPIVEKTKKIEAFFEYTGDHQRELRGISKKACRRLKKNLGRSYFDSIFKEKTKIRYISVKKAYMINKISGVEIFDIDKESVQKISIHQEQIAELMTASSEKIDKVIRGKIYKITTGEKKKVNPEEAKQLNPYLKNNPFDFASAKSYAVQEAKEALKGLPDLPTIHSSETKRGTKRRQTASSGDDTALGSNGRRSRRQRTATAADEQQRTNLNVNPSPHYHQPSSSLDQGSFQEFLHFNAQAALTQEFVSPELGLTAIDDSIPPQIPQAFPFPRPQPVSAPMPPPFEVHLEALKKSLEALKNTTGLIRVKHSEKNNSYYRQHNLGAAPNTNVFNAQPALTQEFVTPEHSFTSASETDPTESSSPEEQFSSSPIDLFPESNGSDLDGVNNHDSEVLFNSESKIDWSYWDRDLNM